MEMLYQREEPLLSCFFFPSLFLLSVFFLSFTLITSTPRDFRTNTDNKNYNSEILFFGRLERGQREMRGLLGR